MALTKMCVRQVIEGLLNVCLPENKRFDLKENGL